jgi:uncharacterized protein HemX
MSSEERDSSSTEMIRRPSPLPWLLLVLVLLIAGVVVYFGYDMLESEKSRSAAALKASDEATAHFKEADSARKGLEEKIAALEAEKNQLSAHADTLSDELEEKEAELAKLKATYDSLEDKMKAEIHPEGRHQAHPGEREDPGRPGGQDSLRLGAG